MNRRLNIYYLYAALPFLGLFAGALVFFDAVMRTIEGNPHPQINYAIFVVTIFGGVMILREIHRLNQEGRDLARFVDAVGRQVDRFEIEQMTRQWGSDIACVLRMLAGTLGQPVTHQQQAAIEHEQQAAFARLESRLALPQFLTGLLVGLGLLGTFVGLLAALGDIGKMVSSFGEIDVGSADLIGVFRGMVQRMEAPMASMAIAFSASMFGLLGSIVLGFMMVSGRACLKELASRLGSEMHEHLSEGIARSGSSSPEAMVQRFGEVMTLSVDRLARELELSFSQVSVALAQVEHKVQGLVEGAVEQAVAKVSGASSTHPEGEGWVQPLVEVQRELWTRLEERLASMQAEQARLIHDDRHLSHTQQSELVTQAQRSAGLLEGLGGSLERLTVDMNRTQQMLTEAQKQWIDTLRDGLPVQLSQPVAGLDKLPEMMTRVHHAITLSASRIELATRELSTRGLGGAGAVLPSVEAGLDDASRELLNNQLEVLNRIEDAVQQGNRVQERAVSAEQEQMNRQRGEMLRVFNEHAESVAAFRSELQRVGRQLGAFHALTERSSVGLLDLLNERLAEQSTHATRSEEILTSLVDAMGRLKTDGTQQLRVLSDLLDRARSTESRTMHNEVVAGLRQVASLLVDIGVRRDQHHQEQMTWLRASSAGRLDGHLGELDESMLRTLDEVALELQQSSGLAWPIDEAEVTSAPEVPVRAS